MLPVIVLIAVNVVLSLLAAPLMDGIERKILARLQGRQGPSVLQTIYDLAKLYRRIGPSAGGRAQSIAPFVALAHLIIALLLVPTFFNAYIPFYGDVIVLLYLLLASSIYVIVGSLSSGNVFAAIGSSRELSMAMSVELLLALVIACLAAGTKSLSLSSFYPLKPLYEARVSAIVAVILLGAVCYIEGLRLPFDIPEAEPELAGGTLIEYSGASLGAALHALYLKRLLLASLLVDLLLPRSAFTVSLGAMLLDLSLVAYVACISMISILFACIQAVSGRYRVDMVLKLLKRLSIVGFVVVILALLGL